MIAQAGLCPHQGFSLPWRAMNEPTTTRFAPSPTGYLHLGNLRTALFNDLLARKRSGRFLLRSEDTDGERSREEYLVAIAQDLVWLGLEYDAGPDREDGSGPYRQSARDKIYVEHYERLIENGRAYPCFCTSEELERSRRRQRRANQPPRYAGTCRGLSAEVIEERVAAGEMPTLRFRVDDEGSIEFADLVRGAQHFELADIGDFVIRRSDGTPAFFFSNAVDDALMGVTMVLRGEDHLANTPRQLCLLQALELRAPTYGHLSMIVGDDGKPLSKRHGAGNLRELRQQGYLPLALLNHLFRLGHACDSGDLMTVVELASRFDMAHLGRAAAKHDAIQLEHWQKLAVMNLEPEQLREWLASADDKMLDCVPGDRIDVFLNLVGQNLLRPSEAGHWIDILFSDEPVMSDDAREKMTETSQDFFETAAALWPDSGDDFRSYAKAISEKTGARGKGLFMPLRLALSGQVHGPELATIAALMGEPRVRLRLEQAAKYCGATPGPG